MWLCGTLKCFQKLDLPGQLKVRAYPADPSSAFTYATSVAEKRMLASQGASACQLASTIELLEPHGQLGGNLLAVIAG